MNYILLIMFVILVFAVTSVIFYRRKKMEEIKQIKLEEDAKRYFVTICHKLLTPYDDETVSLNYFTFRIVMEHFFVMKITKRQSFRTKVEIVISVQFKGTHILDHDNSKSYSYSGFEQYLANFLGDALVHDSYIKYLWKQMEESEINRIDPAI